MSDPVIHVIDREEEDVRPALGTRLGGENDSRGSKQEQEREEPQHGPNTPRIGRSIQNVQTGEAPAQWHDCPRHFFTNGSAVMRCRSTLNTTHALAHDRWQTGA
jgi:hypothetical protein